MGDNRISMIPTHAVVYAGDDGETFHCFAYGDVDAREALAHLSAAGLRGWTLPYDTYLRRDAVGSGAVILEE